MNSRNMKTDEDVIIATSRDLRKPFVSYLVFGACVALGYFVFREIGLILGAFAGVLLNMTMRSFRGVRLWKLCERDYVHLKSKGYSDRNALIAISKSFNSELSESFHEMVVAKFSTLDEVIVFYTGALPDDTISSDEQWAIKCLEKTVIEKRPSGTYKARTKW